MLSIFAPHFFKWTEQLKDSGHEVYWLDIFDSDTKVPQIGFVHQITGWRYRLHYPGRYYLKKKAPAVTRLINTFNELNLQDFLDKKLREIKPDVVHSFVMYLATAPVREVMRKYPKVKWVYSSWGSDLYFYRNREKELREMRETFPELHYMFADCHRDYQIAVENGFGGEFLGVFPGGGGFSFHITDPLMQAQGSRNLILVKGYQGLHGRCISVLRALWKIKKEVGSYKVIVFGAGEEVNQYIKKSGLNNWEVLDVYGNLPHSRVMDLMGKAYLYIGNSLSDGTPNTLLEAIIMGAFPIQSNPGGATAEIIKNGNNGYLINDPEDEDEIAELIRKALSEKTVISEGVKFNLREVKPGLEREQVKKRVLTKYQYIEKHINSHK